MPEEGRCHEYRGESLACRVVESRFACEGQWRWGWGRRCLLLLLLLTSHYAARSQCPVCNACELCHILGYLPCPLATVSQNDYLASPCSKAFRILSRAYFLFKSKLLKAYIKSTFHRALVMSAMTSACRRRPPFETVAPAKQACQQDWQLSKAHVDPRASCGCVVPCLCRFITKLRTLEAQ
jgi:hypothetical protein